MKHGASLLAAVLLAGIAMAWSPRFWSTGVAIIGVCFVAALWAISTPSIERTPRLPLLWLAVGLISVWSVLQFVLHISVAPWLTVRASLLWSTCGISFFLASQVAGTRKKRGLFLAWLLWGVTALAVAALLQRRGEIAGTFLYKNHFAAVMEMAAPIALYQVLAGSRNRSGAAAVAFVAMFAAVVASASRAGVFLLLAELLIAIAVRLAQKALSPKRALSLVIVSVGVLGAASLIAGPERMWEHFHERNPWSVRVQLISSTIQM